MSKRRANKRRARDRREARKYERRRAGWHLRWEHQQFRAFLDEVFR